MDLTFYYDYTMLLLIPGIILSALAQFYMKSTFEKYRKVPSRGGHTAAEVASAMIRAGQLDTHVERVGGELTDHYSPREDVLRLSSPVYDSTSIASLGVAAHETGHAFQDADGYFPMKLQMAFVPVANFASTAAWPLVLIGMIFSFPVLINIGIVAFSAVVFLYLVMLPVEFNASSRAIAALEGTGFLQSDELPGAKKVLRAAALTYVASALTAILQLLRLVLLSRSRRD